MDSTHFGGICGTQVTRSSGAGRARDVVVRHWLARGPIEALRPRDAWGDEDDRKAAAADLASGGAVITTQHVKGPLEAVHSSLKCYF
jgi:hypothetical protein